MKYENIEDFAKLLAVNTKLKLDYKKLINKDHKILIVEGSTDEKFISYVKNEKVNCIVASRVLESNRGLSNKPIGYISCKDAIVDIITAVSHFPSPFIKYPSQIDKWDLYGLIDSDGKELSNTRPTPRLFITDTHDLETMLLSTDPGLFNRLEKCEITQDDINKAFFVAYQLSIVEEELNAYRHDISVKKISCGSNLVDFSSFVDDVSINVPDLVKYIAKETGYHVPSPKIESITNKVCESKRLKKKLDVTGTWKQRIQDFYSSFPSDFWQIVNGHAILQLILHFSLAAHEVYGNCKRYSLHRTFELGIIDAYDYTNFSKTVLSKKMGMAGLLKSI